MYETETEVSMPWVRADGGYATSGHKAKRGNEIVTAIAIATRQPYGTVYRELYTRQIEFVRRTRSKRIKAYADKNGTSISQVGVWPEVYKPYLVELGWEWTPVMGIGTGTTMHLTYDEVPDKPVLLLSISKSMCAVVNGVVHAPQDPSRDGTRAVYGYWTPPSAES